MVKRQEYHKRSNQGGFNNNGPRNSHEQNPSRDAAQPRENNQGRDNHHPKESGQQRYSHRDNQHRQNSSGHSYSRYGRTRAEETVDDIKLDISRLEKEIDLEIKEIKSLRLGL